MSFRLVSLLLPVLVTNVLGTPSAEKTPEVLAHRGASGWAPETTLAAFRLALEMKVDSLELDVQMTRDGEIVAIHDTLVDRTTNGKGPVGEMTLAQLRELDAGSWFNRAFPDKARPDFAGQKIPTLQEIIDLARNGNTGLYIETKNPELYPANFEARLLEVIRQNGFEKRVVIQSFNPQSVVKIKTLDPRIPTALLVGGRIENDPVDATVSAGADELAMDYRILTSEIVNKAHDRGLTVAVWTVNEEEDLRKMIALRVEKIMTNYPDRLNRILGR